MKRILCLLFFTITFVFSTTLFANDTLPGLKPDQFTLSGYGSFVNMRITNFYNKNMERRPEWLNYAVLNLVFNMRYGKNFTGHIGIEGYTYHNSIAADNALMPVNKELMYWTIYPHQIEGDYTFGDTATFGGEIGVGLIPYKYNHEAWNLGEYLFKSGTYPGYLITNFDWTTARLTGIKISTIAFGSWHNDFLFTIAMELPPYHDGTISWLSNISFLKAIEIGTGLSLCNYISADSRFTKPENENNFRITKDTLPDSSITYDTSGYYTFKGIKTMVRLTIDPKAILEEGSFIASIFGKEDCKIYGELAILGLENQKPCYSKLSERMPVMFGFNVPMFKLLDVLSCQFEYYGSPYPNDYGNTLTYSQPGFAAPITWAYQDNPPPFLEWYKHDNWKWSVYANRFFGKGKHFGIVAQAARDHWRTMSTFEGNRDYGDALFRPKYWYWATKAVIIF